MRLNCREVYNYPVVNYYYHNYLIHFNNYYFFSYLTYVLLRVVTFIPKIIILILYMVNLTYKLIIKSESLESLTFGRLLDYYPFLKCICPTLGLTEELDSEGNLKIIDFKNQSNLRCLHFMLFYNIFVYPYYNAFVHLQSFIYIFASLRFSKVLF